jgi:hypothetical protein
MGNSEGGGRLPDSIHQPLFPLYLTFYEIQTNIYATSGVFRGSLKGTFKNFKIKACACDKSGVYIR